MTDEQIKKKEIVSALAKIPASDFLETTKDLLAVLGYRSQRTLNLSGNVDDFIQMLPARTQDTETEGEFRVAVESVKPVFQVTGDEINASDQRTLFESPAFDEGQAKSFMFFAVKLKGKDYARGKYAQFTREINKRIVIPVMVLFQVENRLTIGFVRRRSHKLNPKRNVLEQVTLIKDIDLDNPHRAHLDILFELSLAECAKWMVTNNQPENFDGLLAAWIARLDTEELNKRFFSEIANWYFWAVEQVRFPDDAGEDVDIRNATSVIRLLTRLIFVWFVKEKGLVPDALFNPRDLNDILKNLDPQESTYYKAILQNLFFATLNQEMNTAQHPDNRKFRHRAKQSKGRDQHYMVHSLYRYEAFFKQPKEALRLFETIPFLNGGLFECLDKVSEDGSKNDIRIDGFSDRKDIPLHVPNELFFSDERTVDLNKAYGTKGKKYKVQGLIDTLDRYKFTVTENTPIEEEVALDPELLGKVFENLLAAYNPETGATARKQTGSYYTPREIVNYMTDESLMAHLKNRLDPENINPKSETNLRNLLAYNDEPNPFNEADTETLIKAIDSLKILDPACGSGAFRMGVLHKLVFILGKLDPRNDRWRQRQIDRVESTVEMAEKIDDSTVRDNTIRDLEGEIVSINEAFERNELDYGRKLYLIENCIYGVDIQPIATQIAKLRFFISLIVDQQIDDSRENRGVRPLPNLETKFVAANTLLGVEKPEQLTFRNPQIDRKEKELEDVRRRYFTARTPRTKAKYRDLDNQIRTEIGELLKGEGFPHETTEKIAHWDPYDQNASADFFDPEWMFGVRDGFDVTIGNPPYVRADSGDTHLEMRQKIEDSKQYETLWEKWDLYIPFIERSYKLLKPEGFTTLIVSDAYCHSKYAQKSQNWFLKNSRILRLDFFGKIKIFDAGVRNVTYLFQNADGSHQKPERRVHAPEFGTVNLLPTNEQRELTYRVFFPEDTVVQQFSNPIVTLEEICYITTGMEVQADEKKAQGAFKAQDLVSDVKDTFHPKPFVEGKHLEKWLPDTHKWLEWGTDRAPSLFRSAKFLELYEVDEKILAQRSPGPDPKTCYDNQYLIFTPSSIGFLLWYSLSGIRNRSIKQRTRYRDEKPIRPELPQREELEQTSRRFSMKFLLGVMNSTVAHNFLKANRRSNIHLYPDDWKKLPIPDVSPEQQAPIIELVDQILDAKRTAPDADVSDLENEIDEIVYLLYDLTPDEIAIVEETS